MREPQAGLPTLVSAQQRRRSGTCHHEKREAIMAFGFKLKHVKTKEPFADTKALYERIKDERFYAGKPELVKNGLADVIVFPALDSQNQVWVMMFGKHRIQIQKNQEAGVTNAVVNEAINTVTSGLFGLKSIIGKNAKEIEIQVEKTAKELEALGL